MAKRITAYVCSECGEDHPKWQGQCASCGAWNTLSEFVVQAKNSGKTKPNKASTRSQGYAGEQAATVQKLKDIDLTELPRISTSLDEFDRVLGGGIISGAVTLLGGHPGAGKSTLLLQTLCHLSEKYTCLYITGEESLQQIAMRAKRLELPTDNLSLLAETNINNILLHAQKMQPDIIVIDSIQVVYMDELSSAPGTVSQVRESAAALTRYAKQTQTAMFIVGHVTKEGQLAGPKVLEHIIDCSVLIEGDSSSRYRTLRANKNRFGAVNELGIFAMTQEGMKQVKNPSAIFLTRGEPAPGSIVMTVWEGTRPILVEIQALVDSSSFGHPRRLAVGLEQNRLAMLLAILHRHGGLMVGDQDVFANVVGGIRVTETASDLALLTAIISSFRNVTLPQDLVVFGEVGLSGEIRPVPSGQERLREAAKHGFKQAIVPQANLPQQDIKGMRVKGVKNLAQALEILFD